MQLEGGKKYKMDKLLWDAMAASAITITMEDFFSTFLKKKTTKRNYVAMWLFYFIYHMTIMNMLNGYVGNFVGNVIALSIVCWFSYQSSFAINAMMTFVAISLSGIAEGLIAIAVIMITGSINGNIRIYALIAKIIFWMIVRVLALLYKGKVEKSQRKIYGIILSGSVIANAVFLAATIELIEIRADSMIRAWAAVFVFVLLLFDIVMFKVYVMYQEQNQMKRMKQEAMNQLEIYDRQIHEKQKVMDEVRKTKHDMKNNMIYLQNLLKANPEEAEKYLEKFIGKTTKKTDEFSKSGNFSIDSMLNYKSGNLPVDAVLNYKNMIAKSKGLSLILEEQIPINLPYENSDLCVILGNLLDNAIEAAENSENKEIDVRIVYVKNKLKITVKNYYTGKIKKDTGGNFISTKSDTKNHGIGLQSVTRIVDAYGGVMEVRTDHSVFQVDIII